MRSVLLALAVGAWLVSPAAAQYLGNLTANPFYAPAPPQPPGAFGNPFGSGADSPKLFTPDGEFRGNLNANRYDPNSIANPFGRYGSRYSPDSILNPYGAGNPYSPESPTNPYGTGLRIYR